MTISDFLLEIDQIIQADAGATSQDTELASLEDWDSMAVISFIAMADAKLGITVRVSSLANCKTVGDLAKLCQVNGV